MIRDLGKKHVTYGVASHHVPVMKQVPLFAWRIAPLISYVHTSGASFQCIEQAILSILERILEENWTNETATAWTELWELSASAMMKARAASRRSPN